MPTGSQSPRLYPIPYLTCTLLHRPKPPSAYTPATRLLHRDNAFSVSHPISNLSSHLSMAIAVACVDSH